MNKSISKFKEYSKGFRTMEPRRCKTKGCETILSQYNKKKFCAVCRRKNIEKELK